jgi:hypothetical protein
MTKREINNLTPLAAINLKVNAFLFSAFIDDERKSVLINEKRAKNNTTA